MDVDTVHLDVFAVQEEALVHVVVDGADAQDVIHAVQLPVAVQDDGAERVEIGVVQVPEGGIVHHEGLDDRMLGPGQDLHDHRRVGHLLAVGIQQDVPHGPVEAGLELVDDGGLDPDDGLAALDLLRVVEHAPLLEMGLGGGHQADVAIDAGAAVPARVGLHGIVHVHGDDISAGFQVGSQVIGEAGVAVGPGPQLVAVDPDGAVHIDAVEFDGVQLVLVVSGHTEGLAIPAGTRGEIAHRTAAGGGLDGVELDAPVVGQVEAAPGPVVEADGLGAGLLAELEAPARVEVRDLPGLRRGCQAQAGQQDR